MAKEEEFDPHRVWWDEREFREWKDEYGFDSVPFIERSTLRFHPYYAVEDGLASYFCTR